MKYLRSYMTAICVLMEDSELPLAAREVFNEKELEQAFAMIDGHSDLNYAELMTIVDNHLVDWPRGKNSLRLLLIRMYALMQGDVPDGIMPNLEWYTTMTKSILDFIEGKGFDVTHNYFHAIDEANIRIEAKKLRKTREEAIKIMHTYYKSQMFTKKQTKLLSDKREELIKKIESGQEVASVFASVLQLA